MNGSSFYRQDQQFARAARKVCDNCGSSLLRWGRFGSLILLATDLSAEDRLMLLDHFALHCDAWLCTGCGNFGVFSDWNV